MCNLYKNQIFIDKAEKIHGNKYDYSLVDYKNAKTKVQIICSTHGMFEQTPDGHLYGKGCYKCGKTQMANKQRKTLEQFIKEAKEIHGDKYDYSKSDYIDDKHKITITCSKHGDYEQIVSNHLSGKGCRKCSFDMTANRQLKTLEQFIQKSKEIHGEKYDYSKSNYIGDRIKLTIICNKHGEFKQTANSHIHKKCGCPYCANKKICIDNCLAATNPVIASEWHPTKNIETTKSVVSGSNKKYWFICKKGHEYESKLSQRVFGKTGCPICNESKGEKIIKEYLIKNKIKFKQQFQFKKSNIKKLKFDFAIINSNFTGLIEYQGSQHYYFSPRFHRNNEDFKKQLNRDIAKKQYCLTNNIKLIEIPYWEFNKLPEFLDSLFAK